jgi:hypothetical protein
MISDRYLDCTAQEAANGWSQTAGHTATEIANGHIGTNCLECGKWLAIRDILSLQSFDGCRLGHELHGQRNTRRFSVMDGMYPATQKTINSIVLFCRLKESRGSIDIDRRNYIICRWRRKHIVSFSFLEYVVGKSPLFAATDALPLSAIAWPL